jgi:hypothetical protein
VGRRSRSSAKESRRRFFFEPSSIHVHAPAERAPYPWSDEGGKIRERFYGRRADEVRSATVRSRSMDEQMTVMLPNRIQWKLRISSCPNEVPVPGHEGWSLVTPIGLGRLRVPHAGRDMDQHAMAVYVDVDDEVLLGSDQVVLRYRGPASATETIDGVIHDLLSLLRFVSHQATIPRRYVAVAGGDGLAPFERECTSLGAARLSGWGMRNDLLATAVTEDHLAQLATAQPTDRVHVDVMLDAIHADQDGDFRKAILYGAIALEVCAQWVLEEAYEKALADRTVRHRVIERRVGAAEVRSKDPVWEMISKNDSFGALLHERPLYLLGRSLLQDDEPLYRRALRLYATRNKIVHRGVHAGDEQHLPISREGSAEAIDAATGTLAWLGDHGPYVPARDLVVVDGNILKGGS